MNQVETLLNQIGMMFLIMALGLFLKKKNFYSDNFIKELSALLYLAIGPINVFDSFLIEYSSEIGRMFFISLGISCIIFLVGMILATVFFSKGDHRIERFGSVITNCGFLGLPLVATVCGEQYKIFVIPYIVVNVVIQNTFGIYFYTKDKNYVSLKAILKNETFIAAILGLIVFRFQIPMPTFVCKATSALGSTVAPLVSIIIGANLSETNISKFKDDFSTLFVVLIKQIILPLVGIALLSFIPNEYLQVKIAMLIVIGCPSAASTSAYARLYDADYDKGSRVVCISTISFILTITLLLKLALLIWN